MNQPPDPIAAEALTLLRLLTGDPTSDFRPDQLDVIRRLVADRQRVLLVQRTGWGKSAVYFIATRMLRDRGAGPTLLVSPLLALMRNQIEAAERMGVRAVTINSSNRDEWQAVEDDLAVGGVDVLLISPERLGNPQFRAEVLPEVGRRSGLLVVDEAHCISDWGHDFRPDYRRIVRVLDLLAAGVPVLCCTATANDRVVADVVAQLGTGLAPVRGALGRDGLRLQVLHMPRQEERMAWLAEIIPQLSGTGIVYCLTVHDTERIAAWLQSRHINAAAYTGATDSELRPMIEQALLANDVKVVVATSALGMGFDKPDLSYVIHYQSPGSPIAYYQQVGRAGRALASSWGVLVRGVEDSDIQDYFIHSAFPSAEQANQVVDLLQRRAEPLSEREILGEVNVRQGQLDLMLKMLEVEGAVERQEGRRWLRTLRDWSFDRERVESVTAQRRAEQAQMADYIGTASCRMQALRGYLDDSAAERCGVCDNCSGERLQVGLNPALVQRAVDFLRSSALVVEPRKQGADRKRLRGDQVVQPGRALALSGDGGWGRLIRQGKYGDDRFDDQLVAAAAALVRDWDPEPRPTWVSFVPSIRHPGLVSDFARRLAATLGLPSKAVVVKVRETEPQKTMQNSSQQFGNVHGAFEVRGSLPEGPVLLVDDTVDSRWTLTVVGQALLAAGSGPVHPFALADTVGRSGS